MAMDNVQRSDVPNLNGHGQPKGLAALDRNATQAERNRVIDEFFESFGTWDWLYARSKCRHANFDQSPLVTFSNLPLDILHLITIHLSLPDMIKCRLVSKSWNNLWSDRVVNGVLIRKHFPGAFECLGHSMPAAKLLVQLVRQHSIQGWAKWAATHISWNMGTEAALNSARDGIVSRTLPSSLGSYPPRFIFADGKVAWQAMPSCVVIDDLVAETWQRVSLVSNRLHGISSRLIGFSGVMVLVGDEDNAPEDQGPRPSCRKLIVHHLPSDIQKSIVLPNNLVKCFTYKNSAVFVTRGPEAFVFTWGGALRQLDISVDKGDTIPATCTQDGTAVLFHPVDQGTIFVVSAFYIPEADPEPLTTSGRHRGPKLHSIVVTKYRQGLLEHQKIMPVHVREMTMKIHKANEFGLYSICISNSKGGGRKHVTLLYNVVTESFYEIASGSPANHDWDDSSIITYSMLRQLWNSHLFTSTTSRQDHSEDLGHSFKLAVDSCNAMTAVSESPPRNPRSLSMKMWQHEIRHQERSESPRISFPRTFNISNDFVVICYEKGYFVLCAHGREIRLKEQSAIEDGCEMK